MNVKQIVVRQLAVACLAIGSLPAQVPKDKPSGPASPTQPIAKQAPQAGDANGKSARSPNTVSPTENPMTKQGGNPPKPVVKQSSMTGEASQPSPNSTLPTKPGQPAAAITPAIGLRDKLKPADRDIADVLQRLSPSNRREFVKMLHNDWKDPPEWLLMLHTMISGQMPRLGSGWYKEGQKKFELATFIAKLDRNQNNAIDRDEFPNSPELAILFDRLDADDDNQIRTLDVQADSTRPNNPNGAVNRFGDFLAGHLDEDSNGKITVAELQALIERADKDKLGFVTSEDIKHDLLRGMKAMAEVDDNPRSDPISMLFRGEMGTLEEGPKLGDLAPDFTLPTHDGKEVFQLSSQRGKLPVVLIFGSFT